MVAILEMAKVYADETWKDDFRLMDIDGVLKQFLVDSEIIMVVKMSLSNGAIVEA